MMHTPKEMAAMQKKMPKKKKGMTLQAAMQKMQQPKMKRGM